MAQVEMVRTDIKTGEEVFSKPYFYSKMKCVYPTSNISDEYRIMCQEVNDNMTTFQRMGSGWRFHHIIFVELSVNKYYQLKASSYIPLPKFLKNKHAIVNVKNKNDNECFKWAITSCVYPTNDHVDRLSNYEENSMKFNWKNIKFPVALNDIDKFEKNNPGYSVNVLAINNTNKKLYPLRVSRIKVGNVIDLLLVTESEKSHYYWIKSLSRLLSNQIDRRDSFRFFCKNCFHRFYNETALLNHKEYCYNNAAQKIIFPNKDNQKIYFKHDERSMEVLFVIYADFECFTKNINTCQPNPKYSYAQQYQEHEPSSFCYLVKCFDNEIYKKEEPVIYQKKSEDDNVAQVFVECIEKTVKDIYQKFKYSKEIIMTKEDKENFIKAQKCHICKKPLDKEDKVKDHCHLTGKFHGAAHNKCNLKYKNPMFIPVIFHNLSGYDSHLFIKNLAATEGEISGIPNNEEKYISFNKVIVVDTFKEESKDKEVKRSLRFIDSFRFMASSLDTLSGNLDK